MTALASLVGDAGLEQEHRVAGALTLGGWHAAMDLIEARQPGAASSGPRKLYSLIAYLLSAVALMTMLAASVATSCRVRRRSRLGWSDGVLLGMAGYTVFCLSMSALTYFLKAHAGVPSTCSAGPFGAAESRAGRGFGFPQTVPALSDGCPGDAGSTVCNGGSIGTAPIGGHVIGRGRQLFAYRHDPSGSLGSIPRYGGGRTPATDR